ncbi:MAG TPA: CAP domain-containing protein [Candidatus Dormibacteraeota bacterium]
MRGRRTTRMLFPLLCVAVVACQGPLVHATPAPTPGSSVDRRVVAADGKLLTGDYAGAEAAYRSLVSAEVPGAAAHLSTLLAYENRFQEAIAQAEAGVALRADSDSLARLTRALDWGQDIDAAVQAGARAVAKKPVVPLAHIFYSEALADAGRYDVAARELRTAEDMGGDAYVQAEVYREWSNYYRSRGDLQSELNYSELAVKAEPGFPERPLDLVRYDYGNRRTEAARAITDRLLSAHARNYPLIVGAADAAFTGGDPMRASSLYLAAAQARPDGAEAAVGLAEIDAVVNRDFNAAHDVLLTALQRSPTSSAIYEFLRALDLLVLKKDPAADLGTVAPQRPPDLTTERKTALDAVNNLRTARGLSAVQEDPALAEAAQAHAYFYLFNAGQSQLSGAGITAEDPALPGFTGAAALDRDRHFGYGGPRATEVAGHVFTAGASVQGWIDSVFHRFPLMSRETAAVGFGEARVGPIAVSVLDVGSGPAATGDPVTYPGDGQEGVPVTFMGEVPDPLPQSAIAPAGYPITLQVGDAQQLRLSTSRLLGPDGKDVPSYTLAPAGQLAGNQWALLPRKPLQSGVRYTAVVTGTIDGRDFSQRWSFTAQRP